MLDTGKSFICELIINSTPLEMAHTSDNNYGFRTSDNNYWSLTSDNNYWSLTSDNNYGFRTSDNNYWSCTSDNYWSRNSGRRTSIIGRTREARAHGKKTMNFTRRLWRGARPSNVNNNNNKIKNKINSSSNNNKSWLRVVTAVLG